VYDVVLFGVACVGVGLVAGAAFAWIFAGGER
jgi:hypothetical protein